MSLALVVSDGFYFKNSSPVKSGGCCWASETSDTGGLKSSKLLIRMASLNCDILCGFVTDFNFIMHQHTHTHTHTNKE